MKGSPAPEGTGLGARGLGYRAGTRAVLSDVSIEFPSSTFTGVLGPNGAGKSSLLKLLAAVQRPNGGSVTLHDVDVRSMRRRARAQHLALVEQQVDNEAAIRVQDAVMLGRTPYRRAYTSPTADDRMVVQRSLSKVGLEGFGGRWLESLSGGERQRVHIARALAQETDILLLDEPSNHLDIKAQAGILELLAGLARRGSTVVAALHDLNLAAAYCDNIVVLAEGSIVAAGPTGTTLTAGLVSTVYGIDSTVLTNPLTERPVFAFGRSPAQ